MKKIRIILCVLLFVLNNGIIITYLSAETAKTNNILTIGYQKFTDEIENKKYIQSFTEYLNNAFPDYQLEFTCLSDDTLIHALSWGELDFAICNPYIAIVAEHVSSYTFIATLLREGPENLIVEYQAANLTGGI